MTELNLQSLFDFFRVVEIAKNKSKGYYKRYFYQLLLNEAP